MKKSPSKTKAASTPAKSSKETIAAVKIQKIVRGFLAKQKIILVKKQKQDYNDLIEKLQKEVIFYIERSKGFLIFGLALKLNSNIVQNLTLRLNNYIYTL